MEERTFQARKKKLRLVAGLFVVLLAAFALAGNTLRSLSLPKVYTAMAAEGKVTHDFAGTATVQPGETRALANPAGWKAAAVRVKQGDHVHRGQTLVEYDGGDALQQLADSKAGLKKLELSLNQLHADYIAAANGGDDSAKLGAGSAIETAKLDIATQQQHIANLQKNINESIRLTAPFDGIVTQVHASAGLLPDGMPDVVLSDSAKGYRIQLLVPGGTADLLHIGDTLDGITLDEPNGKPIAGTISSIDEELDSGSSKLSAGDDASAGNAGQAGASLVTMTLKDDTLRGGERVSVKLTASKDEQAITVPNKAVHVDERGAYVYTLREDDGPLGNAYYAVETPIRIVDANDYVTAVKELFADQEVIVDSTGYLMDGVRVRR
ncbi:biotin/lipoyl-binding protein [Paenibacillus rhizovicinus]|uniref:Biotin/lipoyl-binding protein n=1 Tax=Paenibacillus rhizovicinus TaxID=2704463 RepID=A0A6C0NTV6_9BACL|nr:biotin/lipoyl-binding protein [Paenibacillus rhizovicinus]QHW29551.1 biotin/lipoyl-binding protein [Paenibacillus rhizovicinus]